MKADQNMRNHGGGKVWFGPSVFKANVAEVTVNTAMRLNIYSCLTHYCIARAVEHNDRDCRVCDSKGLGKQQIQASLQHLRMLGEAILPHRGWFSWAPSLLQFSVHYTSQPILGELRHICLLYQVFLNIFAYNYTTDVQQNDNLNIEWNLSHLFPLDRLMKIGLLLVPYRQTVNAACLSRERLDWVILLWSSLKCSGFWMQL